MRLAIVLAALSVGSARAEPPRQVPGETIIIRGHAPGYRPAAPARDPRILARYSAAAIEHDAWTRAWLLLDIDDHGVVRRLKFLRRPGYDLERIAIERAFGTRFEPARDGTGRPVASRLAFPIEWPSYWWMVAHEGVVTRLPASVGGVPCRGEGPLNLDRAHPVYRDCSGPDLSRVAAEPWIARPATR